MASIASSYKHRPRRVPALLLFAMFAIAARYSGDPPNVPRPSSSKIMWAAGDVYLEHVQAILERLYAPSPPPTCQALLLKGYCEMGIGEMASAWTCIGMAIRMAQDLGIHRSADGRPLMIFEQNFDKALLDEQGYPDSRSPMSTSQRPSHASTPQLSSQAFSVWLFKQCTLHVVSSRHGQAISLEGVLDKWYYRLPEELQHDPQSLNLKTLASCFSQCCISSIAAAPVHSSPPMEVSAVATLAHPHPQATSGYGTMRLLNDRHAPHTHAMSMGHGHQHRPSMSDNVSRSASASSSTSTSNRHPPQYWHEYSAFPSLENYNSPLSGGRTHHTLRLIVSTFNRWRWNAMFLSR
ncbi:hypothetical protein BT96DRAFT_993395 [Gymnopus androsaceus JB14]|uniref:Xylanolytic transcriptional activator regulatory domain-containing protein n=1 Tax=Gymnopus androsaceus JB14 TaxID=1447944 RepID=A0A6A4HPR4_9AGAR|nr:hypothetical protein BT96DRAFT_993395 [Gymnopus androsaceus JB14]